MTDIPWPLLAAIASASFAFIYAQVSKRLEFLNKRRSVAIAIAVEIGEASKSISSLRMIWDSLLEIADNEDKKPVIVITNDLKILSRVHLEELNFPPSVLVAVTRFQNTIQEAYDFLDALNSERFERMTTTQRVLVVKTTQELCDEVNSRAEVAYSNLMTHFPHWWFSGLPPQIQHVDQFTYAGTDAG